MTEYELKQIRYTEANSFANWLLNNYNTNYDRQLWILRWFDTKIGDRNHPERGTTEQLYKYYLEKYDL